MHLLEASGLTHSYVENGPAVLQDLTFEVKDGEVLAILGPSGCGKSTLLSILAGYVRQNVGTIVFGGKSIDGPAPERQMLHQQDSLLPYLTVGGNISLALSGESTGYSPIGGVVRAVAFGLARLFLLPDIQSRHRAAIEELLQSVGLPGLQKSYPRTLSGGMKRRAEMARCMAAGGRLLLLDEPFTGLDALTKEKLYDLLQRVVGEQKLSAIVVTHDWEEAITLADRVLVMKSKPGEFVAEYNVNLPRPRTITTRALSEYQRLCEELHEFLLKSEDGK